MPTETPTQTPPNAPEDGAPGEETPPELTDAGGYQSFDLDAEGKLVETTDGTPRSVEPPSEKAPEAPSDGKPEAKAPEPGEGETPETPALDDAALEKLLANKDVVERIARAKPMQTRIEELANGRAGNLLQQRLVEREKADKQWGEVETYAKRLHEDDAFYEAQVKEHGEDHILEWRAKYLRESKARAAGAGQAEGLVDREAFAQEFAKDFGDAAIQQFKDIVTALPFVKELPADVAESVKAMTPGENWFQSGLSAIGDAVQAHIAGLQKQHEKDLDEAREAGRNEAAAAREEGRPVRVNGSLDPVLNDPERVIREYGQGAMEPGRFAWTREDYHRAEQQLAGRR